MFANISLAKKLMSGFISVAIIILIVGYIGYNGLAESTESIREIGIVEMPSIKQLLILRKELEALRVAQRTLLIPKLSDIDLKRQFDNIAAANARYNAAVAFYVALPHSKEDAEEFKDFTDGISKWQKINVELESMSRKMADTGIRDAAGLAVDLNEFRVEHFSIEVQVSRLLHANNSYSGGDDHTTCNFGKWLVNFKSTNKELSAFIAQVQPLHQKYHAQVKKICALVAAGDLEGAKSFYASELIPTASNTNQCFNKMLEVVDKSRVMYERLHTVAMVDAVPLQWAPFASLEKRVKSTEENGIVAVDKAQKEAAKDRLIAGIGMLAGFFLAIFAGIFITRSVLKQLGADPGEVQAIANQVAAGDFLVQFNIASDDKNSLVYSMSNLVAYIRHCAEIAEKIASGDLTVEVNERSEKDVLGLALKKMVESLNNFMLQVSTSAAEVSSGSDEISGASQSLSQGATESAASLEEISSSTTEIGGQTKTNAENASQANILAIQTRKSAESGNEKMTEMMGAMSEIQGSSKQIAKIIKVIDDIAFQTNLLALNAAVEAARAGRHGKGFAVVADEVRNLAGRSAKAAKETSEMIESSIEKVNNGTQIASATEKALQEIVASSVKVADLVSEIAAASNEQAQGILEIGQGLEQIEKVTQQNTANAEETAAASEELSGQARELDGLLAQFKLRGEHAVADQHDNRQLLKKKSQKRHQLKVLKPSDVIAFDEDEFGKY